MMMHSRSPLDEGFLRLRRAAELIARERFDMTPDDVMDAFKRAIFAGDLDDDDLSPRLQMEITMPRCMLPPAIAEMDVLPRELYGVNRSTIASVMLCTGALPGNRAHWEHLFDIAVPNRDPELPYWTLATIPFRDFPEAGRRELEALLVSKTMLSFWHAQQNGPTGPHPRIPYLDCSDNGETDAAKRTAPSAPAIEPRRQGRPEKRAWSRIVHLVRELHRKRPDWQKKQLAIEAWALARHEFPDRELPSPGTIQRAMAHILGGGSA